MTALAILWTAPALADLAAIRDHIAANDPRAAAKIAQALIDAVDRLQTLPRRGRPGRAAGTRELMLAGWPWLIVYEAGRETVTILRVLHGARAPEPKGD